MKRRYSTVLAIGALCLFSCFTGMPALAVETTLYVGKHFEVRDHDQPTKYVFNGNTRIARVTGSLSTNTRIQRFRLHSGWNLLSLAVSATSLSEQLQRPGVVASAHSWNAQTGTYSPVPQVAPSGMVLWVNATTNTTLAVVGTYADPVNRQIAAGATYLASSGLEAWTPTLPPSVAAWSFDSQPPVRRSFSGGGSSFNFQPTWHARLTGDLSSINDLPNTFPPGQVLYVISDAPFELEIPDPALRVRYYHQDHLGSSSVMTDAGGALVEETAFYPFGIPRHEHRLRQVEEAYKFTQKERDRESGLVYFEARYLTASLARFAVPDPKYAHPDTLVEADAAAFFSNPQKLNLYAYARNNPLNHVDPTGLDDEAKGKKVCSAEFGRVEDIGQGFENFLKAWNQQLQKCERNLAKGRATQEDCTFIFLTGRQTAKSLEAEGYAAVGDYLKCRRDARAQLAQSAKPAPKPDKPPPSAGSPPSASPMQNVPPLVFDPFTGNIQVISAVVPQPGSQPSSIPTPPPNPLEPSFTCSRDWVTGQGYCKLNP